MGSSTTTFRYFLEVISGENHGARLPLDGRVRTIGRARSADLVLSDLSVSRNHAQVLATDEGVQFVVCDGAAPLVIDGRATRAFEGGAGAKVVLGKTTLAVVAEPIDGPISPRHAPGRTDVRTLLTGVAADVRGLAALHALVEALDRAQDLPTLEAALRTWAKDHASASTLELRSGADAAQAGPLELTERSEGSVTRFSVPAPADEPALLLLTCSTPSDRITDSFRRMLVVAGRLCGSALVRLRRAEIAAAEVAALRTLSFGSARAFLGTSPGATHLAASIPKLAASDVSVLIEGETGVGKSFVARLLHEASARASEPLRILNCASIPESLLESELFGHERGAFTGAVAARAGAFEAAARGTVFLDEIGELSLASQAKLLRVIEDRRFERIGSNRSIELHARVLCATNRDLEAMVREGKFRSDLFFRISVVRLTVPSLRERGEDLVLLAQHLLADAARSAAHRRVTGFAPDALETIRAYPWPGNVRELRNAIEHAVALGEGPLVTKADLPQGITGRPAQPESADLVKLPCDLATVERRAIGAALVATSGNKVKAAALLGISRTTLYTKLEEYDVR